MARQRDIPSGRFVIRMQPGLHAALRETARAAATSLNDYCVRKLALPGVGRPEAAGVVLRASVIAGARLAGLVVFGSSARGEAGETSDVDVLIVLDPEVPITRELYRRWDTVPLRWDGREVEPHFARLPDPEARISGLWAEVAVDGVVLFERELDLSRRLARIRSRIVGGEVTRRWSNGRSYWVAA